MDFDLTVLDIHKIIIVNDRKYINKKANYSPDIKYHELIFRPAGCSVLTIDDTSYKTFPFSVFYIPPDKYSSYSAFFKEPDIFIDIFFKADKPISDKPILIDVSNIKSIEQLFKKAYFKWIKRESGYRFDCISFLYQILSKLGKTNYIPEAKFSKIKPAINYIEDNYLKENISCKYLAELCKINYSYLDRLFKEKFDLSPKKYIIQLKINYARNLLESGVYSVSEAAEELHFSDVYFFSRQFKEYTGRTPSEYTKSK